MVRTAFRYNFYQFFTLGVLTRGTLPRLLT